ncbi:hypothetical protein RRG08_060102, partial [Elysia crispata]
MKIILLFLLQILQVIRIQGIFDPCYFWPGSVYAGDGMCFKFEDKHNTFNGSQLACKNDGATLAEVRTQQQMDTAKTLSSHIGDVWLGGWDPKGGSNFVWISNGEKVFPHAMSFHNSSGPHEPICLVMDMASELTGQDCGHNLRYTCQIYAGNPCDVFLPGAEYYDNNCFLPVDEPMTLQDAMLHCEKRNAKVVEPSTETSITYITRFAIWNFDPNSDIWLGMTNSVNKFKWQSTAELVTAGNWASGDLGPSELTADSAVVMNGSSSWVWEVVSRSDAAGVICQRNIAKECNGVFSSGRCLNIYLDRKSWSAAKAACKDKGSYLAEPKTETLERTVKKYISDTADAGNVYLGATNLETEDAYMWDYSRELLADTFTDWQPNQPDNHNNVEHYLGHMGDGWNDFSVGYNLSFLCERVIPVYTHSYVVVLPKEGWANAVHKTKAMLSVASFPNQQGHNYVEFSTFPTGDLQTISLFNNEIFQYSINVSGVSLNSSGFQRKYIRVKSTDNLDVHFFLWSVRIRYACSTLVLEDIPQGSPSSFLTNPGQKDSSLAIVLTEETSSTLELALSGNVISASFALNNIRTQTGKHLFVSTSLTEQFQGLYVDSISSSHSAQLVHSTGALNVFRFSREYTKVTHDVSCDQILPSSMIGSDYITFPSLPMNVSVTDHYTVVAVHSDTTITIYDPDASVAPRKIFLKSAGDVFDLELSASGFYHVNGTNPFYLYARLTGA